MKRQATAKLNNLRVAPRKVRLLVDLIRGMHVAEALMQLKFSKKHAATSVMKLLRSAVANAEHNADIDIDTLIVKEAYVDGGPILYRWMPRAFGRAGKIRKRTSHIQIVLAPVSEKPATKNDKRKAAKAEQRATRRDGWLKKKAARHALRDAKFAPEKKADEETEKSVEKKSEATSQEDHSATKEEMKTDEPQNKEDKKSEVEISSNETELNQN